LSGGNEENQDDVSTTGVFLLLKSLTCNFKMGKWLLHIYVHTYHRSVRVSPRQSYVEQFINTQILYTQISHCEINTTDILYNSIIDNFYIQKVTYRVKGVRI
jgi:hypothetical protein